MSTSKLSNDEFNKLLREGPEGATFVEVLAESIHLFHKNKEQMLCHLEGHWSEVKHYGWQSGWSPLKKWEEITSGIYLLTHHDGEQRFCNPEIGWKTSWFKSRDATNMSDGWYLLTYDSGNKELCHPGKGLQSQFFRQLKHLSQGQYELTDYNGEAHTYDTDNNHSSNTFEKILQQRSQPTFEVTRRGGFQRIYDLLNGNESESCEDYKELSGGWFLLTGVKGKQQFWNRNTDRKSPWLPDVTVTLQKDGKSAQVTSVEHGTVATFDYKEGKMSPFQMTE